jgi:hypothetical protein
LTLQANYFATKQYGVTDFIRYHSREALQTRQNGPKNYHYEAISFFLIPGFLHTYRCATKACGAISDRRPVGL